MTIARRMDHRGMVTTRVSGQVTLAEMLGSILELGELTAYSNELWEIVLFDNDLRVTKDYTATLEVAHGAKEIVQFKSRGAIAFVAPDPLVNRFATKVAELLRGGVLPITVFDDVATARKWLDIHREQSRINATTIRMAKPRDDTRFRPDLENQL